MYHHYFFYWCCLSCKGRFFQYFPIQLLESGIPSPEHNGKKDMKEEEGYEGRHKKWTAGNDQRLALENN
jgi:hypothetical protein